MRSKYVPINSCFCHWQRGFQHKRSFLWLWADFICWRHSSLLLSSCHLHLKTTNSLTSLVYGMYSNMRLLNRRYKYSVCTHEIIQRVEKCLYGTRGKSWMEPSLVRWCRPGCEISDHPAVLLLLLQGCELSDRASCCSELVGCGCCNTHYLLRKRADRPQGGEELF